MSITSHVLVIIGFLLFVCNGRSETDYTALKFQQMIEISKTLSSQTNIFHVENVFSRYPELQKNNCKELPCYSPLIEMTNYQSPREDINSRPTILVVAGLNNTQLLGPNAIFRLLEFFSNNYLSYRNVLIMLNSVRILFLPFANVEKYYNINFYNSGEFSSNLVPSSDFNWDNNEFCFVNSGASIINRLTKDNLIIGLLHFDEVNNQLLYPWGIYNSTEKNLSSADIKIFESITTSLQKATDTNDLDNFITHKSKVKGYIGPGSLEDWAYGGSFQKSRLNFECLREDSPYNKHFLETDDVSNRIFPLRVQNKLKKGIAREILGNDGVVFSRVVSLTTLKNKSKMGYLSRNMLIQMQYFQNMRPIFNTEIINDMSKTNISNKNYSIYLNAQLNGCNSLGSIVPEQKKIKFQFVDNIIQFSKGPQHIYLAGDLIMPRTMFGNTDTLDISLIVSCDSKLKNQHIKDPQSNFGRSKLASQYFVKKGDFSFNEYDQFKVKIYNIRKKLMGYSFHFQNRFNEIQLLYNNQLMIRLGQLDVFLLNYESSTKQMHFELHPDFNRDGRNKDLFNLLTKNLDQLELTFFEEHDYYYVTPDNSVLKDQHKFNGTKEKTFKEDKQISDPDLRMKIGQKFDVCHTTFFNLVGKRVILSIPGKKQNKYLQGTVMIDRYRSKQKEIIQQLMFQTKMEITGLLVPIEGLSCSSKSIFSAGQMDKSVKYYRLTMSIDGKDENWVHFELNLESNIPHDKVQLVWKDIKIEMTKLKGVYIGYTERSAFKVGGMQVKVLAMKDPLVLFDCSPEKSPVESSANNFSEVSEHFQQRKKQAMEVTEPQTINLTKVGISYVIFGGLFILVIAFAGFFLFINKSRKEEDNNDQIEELN